MIDMNSTYDVFISYSRKNKSGLLRMLAINEYLRWNAFHIMMGYYRTWNVLDAEKGAMDHV